MTDLRRRLETASFTSAPAPLPPSNKVVSADVEMQLRDTTWKLQQLQAQYDYLISKNSSQTENNRDVESRLEDALDRIQELKRLLEELRYEKEKSDTKAAKVKNLEEYVQELKTANQNLEAKLTSLCSSPFISDAFGQHEARLKYEELVKERENLLVQVDHLQEAVRTHYSALNTLKQQAAALREEKETVDRLNEELKLKLQELESGNNLVQEQMRMFSNEDGIDVETLEKALTMVKRRDIALERLPFLEAVDSMGDDKGLVTIPAMKRKFEEYQLLNLRLTQENERLDHMLKSQADLNKELHKELTAMSYTRDKDKNEMQQRVLDIETLALNRLDKIHSLEAQLRQFIYGVTKNNQKIKNNYQMDSITGQIIETETNEDDNNQDLITELLRDSEEIKPDENLLEIWIKNATLKDGVLTPGSSTFVVIDFFDYESQSTSVLAGAKPAWDFAATYKLSVDDFLLRVFATDVVTFELNMAAQGDFTLLGRCTIPLASLLKSKPRIRIENHPIISARTGQIIANICIDMRLAIPISELYRLFLERHPNEKKHIEELAAKRLLEQSRTTTGGINDLSIANNYTNVNNQEDSDRLYNELDIIIHRVDGLPIDEKAKKPPTPYIHFQFLGHPDKFTNPIFNTISPIYNEKFTFPIVTTDSQLRLLSRSKLTFSVIDMEREESKSDENLGGIIGEADVSLAALHEGLAISDRFNLKDGRQNRCGEIFVTIKWRYPLRKQRELGPNALSGIDVETIISAFSYNNTKDGLVDYESFIKFISPSRAIQEDLDNLRNFFIAMLEKESKTIKELLSNIFDNQAAFDCDFFIKQILRYKNDIPPNQLTKIFEFMNNSEENKISLGQFISVLNIDEVSGISFILINKLRSRSHELASRGIKPLKFFEQMDNWGANGVITRLEFKNVLKKMGFQLIDEPEEVIQQTVGATKDKKKKSSQVDDENQLLDDSSDHILEHGDELLLEDGTSVRKNELNEFMAKQRDIFEQKKAELQQKSKELLQDHVKSTLQRSRDDVGAVDHRVSMETKGVPPGKLATQTSAVGKKQGDISSDDERDKLATKLQSRFRGFQTRKQLLESSPSHQHGPASHAGIPRGEMGSDDIISVENLLLASLKGPTAAVTKPPNLIEKFLTVDSKRTGYVNRQQFAHVITQFPALQLNGKELRLGMNYFDLQNDGKLIDYTAFLKFYKHICEYQPVPIVAKFSTIFFTHSSVQKFKEMDVNRSGYLSKNDVMKGFIALGYSFAQNILLAIIKLFELQSNGSINYMNMCEFFMNTPENIQLQNLSQQFYSVMNENHPPDDHQLRKWFQKIDSRNEGRFVLNQFVSFLVNMNLTNNTDKEILFALYNEMDANGSGVDFSSFISWMKRYYTNQLVNPIDSQANLGFIQLNMDELQRKCYNFVNYLKENSLFEATQSTFEIYNWRQNEKGFVSKRVFVHLLQKLGFPLSIHEIRMITTQFSTVEDHSMISYHHFFTWCGSAQPVKSSQQLTTAAGTPGRREGSIIHSPQQIASFLEKHLKRGNDLIALFSRYDMNNSSRISIADFISCLSDLGMSSISFLEAKEFADVYHALSNQFIYYKRILSDLLNEEDRQAREEDDEARIDPIDKLVADLKNHGHDIAELRRKIEYADPRSTGQIHYDDLKEILNRLSVHLTNREFSHVTSNHLSNNDFILYASMLRALERRTTRDLSLTAADRSSMIDLPVELSDKLKSCVESLILRGINYHDEIDSFDPECKGTILHSDLRDLFVNKFKIPLSEQDFLLISRAFRNSQDPRKIDIIRFLFAIHPRNNQKNFDRYTYGLRTMENADALRRKIRIRYDYLVPGTLKKPFQQFSRDRNVSKPVYYTEFSAGLKNMGFQQLSSEEMKGLFNLISLSSDECFTYNEFVVFITDPEHLDIIWKLRRMIARSQVREKDIERVLLDLDENSSNILTSKQFRKALRSLNIELADSDILRLILRFDVDESQRLDVFQFIDFLKGSNKKDSEGVSGGMEADLTRLWDSMRSRIVEKMEVGYTKGEIFGQFSSASSTIDVGSLEKGLKYLGLNSNRTDIRNLLKKMLSKKTDDQTDGIDKNEFFKILHIDIGTLKRRRDNQSSPSGRPGRERGRYGGFVDSGSEEEEFENERDRPIRDIVRSIRKSLEGFLGAHYYTSNRLKEVFSEFDRDGNNRIDRRELKSAMSHLKVDLTGSEIDLLFERFDKDHNNNINYKEFLDLIGAEQERESRKGRRGQQGSSGDRDELRTIVRAIRRQLEDYLGPGFDSSQRLREVFIAIDRNGNKKIDRRELKEAMARLKVDLSVGDIDLLFEKYDTDRSSNIDYREFLELIGSDGGSRGRSPRGSSRDRSGRASSSELKEIIRSIRKRLEDYLGPQFHSSRRLREVFSDIDRNGNNKIDRRELKEAMMKLKVDLSSYEVDQLFEKFDSNGNNNIDYNEFLEMIGTESDEGRDRSRGRHSSEMDEVVSSIRRRLEDYLGPQFHSSRRLKEVFTDIDRDGNNKLDKRELKKAMDILKVDLRPREIDMIFEKFDKDRSGYIDYREFLDLIGSNGDREGRSREPERGSTEVDEIIRSIRKRLEDYLGPQFHSSRRLKEVFTEIDRDGNNKLDKRELKKAMDILKVDLRSREIDLLFDRFDKDGSNYIDYREFLDLLGSGSDRDRGRSRERISDELEEVVTSIRRRLEEYLGPQFHSSRRLKEVFTEIDRDGNNKLDQRELKEAMRVLKVDLRSREIDMIYEKFDKDRSGFIDYREFLDLIGSGGDRDRGRGSSRDRSSNNSEVDEVIRSIRKRLEDYLGPQFHSSRRLKEVFSEIDRDGNNKLDKRELKEAMSVLKVDLRSREIDLIFERFDRDRSNSIDYREFLDLVGADAGNQTSTRDRSRGRDSSRERNVGHISPKLEEVVTSIRRRLEDYLGPQFHSSRRLKEVFIEIDRDGNNKLDKRELKDAMGILKVDLRSREIDMIYEKFDKDSSGYIDYREFLDLVGSPGQEKDRESNREVDEIIKSIRRRLEDYLGPQFHSSRRLKEVFTEIDRDGNNKVDRKELKEAMAILKVDLRTRDIDLLFDKFDKDRSNYIDYREFLDLVGSNRDRNDRERSREGGSGSSSQLNEVVNSIQRRLEDYLGPSFHSSRRLKEAFTAMDRNGNGKLDKRELKDAMTVLKVDLRSREIDLIFEKFDRNRNGDIDYKEFLELIGAEPGRDRTITERGSSRERSSAVGRISPELEEVVTSIRRRLEDYLGPQFHSSRRLKEVFSEMDRDRNSKLDKRELKDAMGILKVDLRSREIDMIYEKFDKDSSGYIDYREFLDLIGAPSSSSTVPDRDRDSSTQRGRTLSAELTAVVQSIRKKLEEYLGPQFHSSKRIKEVFTEIDRDGNNKLDKKELKEAMAILKVSLRSSDIDLIYTEFDRDRSGYIDYQEFLQLIGVDSGKKSGK
jgi:Ca2+-binding EF-hand superfamily protein